MKDRGSLYHVGQPDLRLSLRLRACMHIDEYHQEVAHRLLPTGGPRSIGSGPNGAVPNGSIPVGPTAGPGAVQGALRGGVPGSGPQPRPQGMQGAPQSSGPAGYGGGGAPGAVPGARSQPMAGSYGPGSPAGYGAPRPAGGGFGPPPSGGRGHGPPQAGGFGPPQAGVASRPGMASSVGPPLQGQPIDASPGSHFPHPPPGMCKYMKPARIYGF